MSIQAHVAFYWRRATLSRRAILGELGFFAYTIVMGIAAVESIAPFGERVTGKPVAITGVLGWGLYSLAMAAPVVVNYRERYKRVDSERARAEAAILPLLEIPGRMCPGFQQDKTIRANVMVLKKEDTLTIVFKSGGMNGAQDEDLELSVHQGNAGSSMLYGHTMIANDPKPQEHRLDAKQYALTKDLRTIISVPITDPSDGSKIVGVLNIDSQNLYSKRTMFFELRRCVSSISRNH